MKKTLAIALLLAVAPLMAANPPKVPAKPADLHFRVTPDTVAPGDEVRVRLEVEPIEGIKINRYPQVKLEVPARDGLVAEARIAVGDDEPPPPEKIQSNFFDEIVLELPLTLDADAPAGDHELDARVIYYYCLKSQFCSRKKVDVTIPISVR